MKNKIKDKINKVLFLKQSPEKNKAYDNFGQRRRLMKAPKAFSQVKLLTIGYFILFSVLMYAAVRVVDSITTIRFNITDPQNIITHVAKIGFFGTVAKYWWLFLFLFLLGLLLYAKLIYDIKTSFVDLNVGQKGTARWTTREELKEQYKSIPDKEKSFSGHGGIVIAREGSNLYIDDNNNHNIIIGTTRSGKGEIEVFPMIDIYSRAEKKASMIINDPKLELAGATIPVLRERGYDCHILNLIDPDTSMGYNPLPVIIEEVKNGTLDAAQQQCSSFAYTVFEDDKEEKDKYFTDMARNVFTAIIMAQTMDLVEEDRKINNAIKKDNESLERAAREEAIRKLPEDMHLLYLLKTEIEEILKTDPRDISLESIWEGILPRAVMTVRRSHNLSEDKQKSYLSMMSYKEEEIRKYLKSELPELKYTYEPKPYTRENEKKINLYSITRFAKVLNGEKWGKNEKTQLDRYFQERPEDDFARITYADVASASPNTKGTIMSVFGRKTAIFAYESIAKMTAESTLDMLEIGFGKKPIAVFIGLPDYDKSNHFIGTVFIDQLYYTLAKYATAAGGKCTRRVIFLLDEFGNMPKLSNIESMVSVGAGREMLFTLILQSYAQLEGQYGESVSNIILDNCANTLYLLSTDQKTAQQFSDNLGKETISVLNRTGKMLALKKERTEMFEEKPLLDAYELMHLKPGEMIVKRVMKRTDLKGNSILSTPIKSMAEDRMKFRYEYLLGTFPSGQLLYRSRNMERIYKINEDFKDQAENLSFLVLDPPLETTTHINLIEIANTAEKFVEHDPEKLFVDAYSKDEVLRFCKTAGYSEDFTNKLVNKEETHAFSVQSMRDVAEKNLENSYPKNREIAYKLLKILDRVDQETDRSEELTEDEKEMRKYEINIEYKPEDKKKELVAFGKRSEDECESEE